MTSGTSQPVSPAGMPIQLVGSGHPQVDAVLVDLATIESAGLEEQVARYTAAHESLVHILQTIDEG